jgi:hypothetical protein
VSSGSLFSEGHVAKRNRQEKSDILGASSVITLRQQTFVNSADRTS